MPRDGPVTQRHFSFESHFLPPNVAQTRLWIAVPLIAAQEDSRNHEVLDGAGVGVLCLQTDDDSRGLGASVDGIRRSHELAPLWNRECDLGLARSF